MEAQYRKILPHFYSLQIWIFKLYGNWTLDGKYHKFWHIIYRCYFYLSIGLWMLLPDIMLSVQVVKNIDNLNELIRVVYIFGTMLSVQMKFFNIKRKCDSYLKLIKHLYRPMFIPRDAEEVAFLLEASKLSRLVRNCYGWLSFCSLNTMQLTKINVHTKQLPLPVYNPVALSSTCRYVLAYFYLYSCISCACYINIGFDSLSASLLIYIRGQLDILAKRMRKLGKSKRSVNVELQECIAFHAEIEKLTRMIENMISAPISVQIFCSVVVLVANFYCLAFFAPANDYFFMVKFAIYQFCMIIQIFIVCYFSTELTLGSEKLLRALYEADWVHWNREDRKHMLMMMLRLQNPIRIKTLNRSYSINLEAFSAIVHTSYSYFALLKRMNSK